MSDLDQAISDLVVANRILANEDVVDAYGHVSIRHPTNPDHYLLSCSRSPELVDLRDIVEFHLDGTPVHADDRPFYIERHIHGAIYEARPEINAAAMCCDTTCIWVVRNCALRDWCMKRQRR